MRLGVLDVGSNTVHLLVEALLEAGPPPEVVQLVHGRGETVGKALVEHPEVPVIPAFLHGLGKSLPKGSAVFVPFCCDVVVGEPIPWQEDRKRYMQELRERMSALAGEIELAAWE